MDFVPNTEEERKEMLEAIGKESLEELFSDIPDELRERCAPLGLAGLSERKVKAELDELARMNAGGERISLIGAGLYDHYIPAVVRHVTGRSEFYTAYTPYQAEVSQGTLTWMFEFQTAVCELTGMEIANSSMYDGGSAAAEALLMALRVRREGEVAVAQTVNPWHREVIDTYLPKDEASVLEVPYDSATGRLDREYFRRICRERDLAALLVQSPNYFGLVEELEGLKEELGEGLLVVSANPISLGMLQPPARFGADVVVGEGQPLGNPISYGGPALGLFATRERYLRYIPGRLSGRTEDREGEEGYVMALQTREQHIRRERATSNICTNQALNALAATVYLAGLGAEGLEEVARTSWDRAHYLAQELTDLQQLERAWETPFFNEFVLRVEGDPLRIWTALKDRGIDLLHPRHLSSVGLEDCLMLAATEKLSKEELNTVLAAFRQV